MLSRIVDMPAQTGIYTFFNFYSYLMLRNTSNLKMMDGFYVDGYAAVLFLRLFGYKNLQRCSFDMTSLAGPVFMTASNKNYRVAIVGSTKTNLELAVQNLEMVYDIDVVIKHPGFFDDESHRYNVIKCIVDTKVDLLVVGMGTPLQEEFLLDCAKCGYSGVGYTCGGFLHQTAKRVNYYPEIFDKFNLRWMYRIIDEPYLLRRYLISYPRGLLILLFDLITCFSRHGIFTAKR